MNIDRTNYEIWFIDWLDGNLDSHQIEQLNLFLNENPDLKEEFKELAPVIINHSDSQYKNKESLKKSPSDISDSQFEFLCVSYLENDLSDEQKTELFEIAEQDDDKKRLFDLIQKTKISPVPITYKHKTQLFRITPLQKVIRLSVIGLSAAAAIILVLTVFLNAPRDLSNSTTNTASIIIPEKIIQKQVDLVNEARSGAVKKKEVTLALTELPAVDMDDTLLKSFSDRSIIVNRINFTSDITLKESPEFNTLVASNIIYTIPDVDDGRSNVSRFISKTFREKVLKDNSSQNSPLKGYEIAEAGVTGLNKLLGWEMALDKNNDETGELSSVYFSSKLLKFNSPVKKSESSE